MTDIPNKSTKIADEHVDNNRTLFNSVWWFKNDSSTSVIGDYTVGNHTSLHDISCGWGHAKLTDAHFNPQEAVAPDGLITKAIYDDFGSYAGLAQLRTNKPQAADDSGISTEPDIDTHSSRITVDYENAVRYHEDPTFVTGNMSESGNMEGPKFVERAYTDNLRQIIDFFKEFISTYVTSRREVRMNTVKSVTDLMTTEK